MRTPTENSTMTATTIEAPRNLLTEIAKKHLHIETLVPRDVDGLDFHEIPVWRIQAALEAAFRAGVEAARREAK